MYINIHSHQKHTSSNGKVIKNIAENFYDLNENELFSIGLHPWFINKNNWQHDFKLLEITAKKDCVIAIGECGMDKVCKTDLSLQQTVFGLQIVLANELKKPIIIHCVKGFDEIHNTLLQKNNKVPVIFHGFNSKKELAVRLIKNGYFLSFGKSIIDIEKAKVLKELPLENIFFETDNTDIDIENIYNKAAGVLEIRLEDLKIQIQKNARNVFGKHFI